MQLSPCGRLTAASQSPPVGEVCCFRMVLDPYNCVILQQHGCAGQVQGCSNVCTYVGGMAMALVVGQTLYPPT
jgi:hypothetical protein